MIRKNEVLLKSSKEWLHFTNPHRIISVAGIDDVHNALQEIERLVEKDGWHAAGFVSYEAAPAFDSALHVLSAEDFPLLWFGLYPEPHIIKTTEVFAKRLVGRDLGGLVVLNWQPGIDRKSYNTAIEKIKDAIALGNTYQVNYAMRLNSEFGGREWGSF